MKPLGKSTNLHFHKYNQELFIRVKNKQLFHSGHFHWSEHSRSHNWIDVAKLLQNATDMDFCKNAIINCIRETKQINVIDCIIGLGIEGNILGTKASIRFNKPYSYLPYSYRYQSHNSFEKKLYFIKNNVKTVLIITDVVYNGRSLRRLVNKEECDKFQNIEKIIVVSLFYTGHKKYQVGLLNKTSTDISVCTEDFEEDRIEFYFVCHIPVESCPYGANYKQECIIVREGMGCVHKFYDDNK